MAQTSKTKISGYVLKDDTGRYYANTDLFESGITWTDNLLDAYIFHSEEHVEDRMEFYQTDCEIVEIEINEK